MVLALVGLVATASMLATRDDGVAGTPVTAAGPTTTVAPPCTPLPYQACGAPTAPFTNGVSCTDAHADYDGVAANGCEAAPDDLNGTRLGAEPDRQPGAGRQMDRYPFHLSDHFQLLCNGAAEVTLTAPAGAAMRLEVLQGTTPLGTAVSTDGTPATVELSDPDCLSDDGTDLVRAGELGRRGPHRGAVPPDPQRHVLSPAGAAAPGAVGSPAMTDQPTPPGRTGLDALGVTFASFMNLGLGAASRAAALAEELDYRSFWTAETVGPEAFSVLAAIGAAAPSLDLGTGVLALQLRTPALVAMAGATLQALHPDRDILLGVGISSPVVTEKWHGAPYGDRPLARVREYVTVLRECLSGESVSFKGDFYELSRFRLGVKLGERRPKIVVGALNPRMLALAGELADGVLLNYLPASHVPWSIEQVRAGTAGRADGGPTVYAYVHAGVCERADGIELARRDLFSYAVVDAYARNFERAGFAAEVAAVRGHHAEGDREAALGAVSDAMVDAIDVMGDADTVRHTVKAYVDAGVDVPVLMPLPWGPDRMAVIDATMPRRRRTLRSRRRRPTSCPHHRAHPA